MNTPTLDDVACLNARGRNLELKSVVGHHCDVWQMSVRRGRGRKPYDVVVKKYRGECSFRQVQVLDRDYRRLKASLEDIVPDTVYVPVRAGVGQTVIAIARAVVPWFNLANPINEDDAVPLLRKLPKARNQLMRFCHAGRKWAHEAHGRMVDLYGIDNLVLSTNREICYLDSFHVFFYADMLHFLDVDDDDDQLSRRMEISSDRFLYLEHLLEESRKSTS